MPTYRRVPTMDGGDHGPAISSGSASSPTLQSPSSSSFTTTSRSSERAPMVAEKGGGSASAAAAKSLGLSVSTARPSAANTPAINLGPTSLPEQTSSGFIRLVGVPSGSDPTAVDTVVVHSASINTPKPAPLELSPTSAARHLVDVIAAENEDPFTLEPFESLLRLCAESGKDFLLARVTTVDPNDDTKFYYSYYAAHHINKVLFRTQPEEGLLHRMKAKNVCTFAVLLARRDDLPTNAVEILQIEQPLNNMTIVGDVHYYSVAPEAYFEGQRNAGHIAGSKGSPTSSASSAVSRKSGLFGRRGITLADRIRLALFSKDAGGIVGDRRKLHLVLTDTEAHLDPDATSKQGVQGQQQARRPSADDIFQFVAKSSPTDKNTPLPDLEHLHPPSQPISLGSQASLVPGNAAGANVVSGRGHKRSKSTTAAHAIPVSSNNRHENSSLGGNLSQRWDWVAQFNSKSTINRGDKLKVRSISYRNERMHDAEQQILSVEEWVSLHCGEPVARLLTRSSQLSSASGRSPSGNQEVRRRHEDKGKVGDGGARTISGRASDARNKPIMYEAKFYATDDDFLMKSSVRAYFKLHAMEADDAVLFTIPSTATVILNSEDGMEPHPALAGFHYSIEGEGGARSRFGRIFSGSHLLKYLLVVYIVVGALLIKFVIPENLVYLVTFLMVFALCFFLVFFVEFDL